MVATLTDKQNGGGRSPLKGGHLHTLILVIRNLMDQLATVVIIHALTEMIEYKYNLLL